MNTKSVVAILLIVIGIVAFVYQGFSYTTTEKAVDIGPIQINTEKEHTFPIPPIVGGIALVGGILLLALGNKRI